MLEKYLKKIGRNKKRRRGPAAGGKTCGRGTKGQTRKKDGPRKGFEGGQTPINIRSPKREGFSPRPNLNFLLINLSELEGNKKILTGQTLNFSQEKKPVKVLGQGELKKKLTVEAWSFSKAAQRKIEQAGGKVKVINKYKHG